jgi:hypothetical protein
MSWRLRLGAALLALAMLLGGVGARPAAAADPLGDDTYAAWAADHAQRLLRVMQLPDQFTVNDLREVAAQLGELITEARAIEAPSRYTAAHSVYLASMDALDRVRTALETVALTRQAAPDLADALFEAEQRVASGLHQLRDAGVTMPTEVVALLETGPDLQALPATGSAGATNASASAPSGSAAGAGSSTQSPASPASAMSELTNPDGASSDGALALSPIAPAPLTSTWATSIGVRGRHGVTSGGPHGQHGFGQRHGVGPGFRFRFGGGPMGRGGARFTR